MLRHHLSTIAPALAAGAAVLLATHAASADAARGAERLAADGLVGQAEKEPRQMARADFLRAGEAYLALWHEAGAAECKQAGEVCARNAEVLFNAASAFRAAGEISSARATRAILLDPANHLDQTELAKKTRFFQGDDAMAIADYASAASALEDAVRVDPRSERALQALQDATVLRLGLGDLPRATADADEAEKLFAARQPDKVALFDLAIVLSLFEHDRWNEVDRFIGAHSSLLAKVEPVRSLQLEVVHGKALAHLGRKKDSDVLFHRVAGLSQTSIEAAASKGPSDEDSRMRALGHALTAAGDAKLALADEERDRAMGLAVKKGDRPSVDAKRDAIELVEKHYLAIVSMEPTPPLEATVTAAGRVAAMRSTFWAQAFLALGDAGAAEDEQKALEANRTCVDTSVRFEWSNAGSKACDAWLVRHDPQRRAMTELIPAIRDDVEVPNTPIFVDANGAPWAPP